MGIKRPVGRFRYINNFWLQPAVNGLQFRPLMVGNGVVGLYQKRWARPTHYDGTHRMAGAEQVMSSDKESRPSPIDVHVGSRIRLRRTLLGMSQERLGDSLGLTFQQVQKYERGVNRVGASRLFDLSRVLDVPISFFFEDM